MMNDGVTGKDLPASERPGRVWEGKAEAEVKVTGELCDCEKWREET